MEPLNELLLCSRGRSNDAGGEQEQQSGRLLINRSRHHFNTSEEFIFDLGEETKIRGSLSIFASFHFNTQ